MVAGPFYIKKSGLARKHHKLWSKRALSNQRHAFYTLFLTLFKMFFDFFEKKSLNIQQFDDGHIKRIGNCQQDVDRSIGFSVFDFGQISTINTDRYSQINLTQKTFFSDAPNIFADFL